MTEKKKSFVMYLDYQQHFELLTDEQLGKLIRAIFAYESGRAAGTERCGAENVLFIRQKSA